MTGFLAITRLWRPAAALHRRRAPVSGTFARRAGLAVCLGIAVVSGVLPGMGALQRAQAFSLFGDDTNSALGRFATEFNRIRPAEKNTLDRTVSLFNEILLRVQTEHVRPAEPRSLVDAAITALQKEVKSDKKHTEDSLLEAALNGMLGALDPYSSYLNAKEHTDMEAQMRGQFGGLGVEVSQDKESSLIKVVSPIDDTPAARAGLTSGDFITHLDGESVKGMSLNDAVSRMRGPAGTAIRLTVQRGATVPPFQVSITRAIIKIQAVRWKAENEIGYIRLTTFNNKHTAVEVQNAVQAIRTQIGSRLAGLVIDLRNNPGGLLDQAVAVADLLLERGVVVSIRGRKPGDTQDYYAATGDIARSLPVVVLINGGSASASEIVASALQDYRRALIFGTRSYGKGSVQTITPLSSEGALRLTTARYYRPTHGQVDCLGVSPNVLIHSTRKSDPPDDEHQKGPQCEGVRPVEIASPNYKPDEVCPTAAAALFRFTEERTAKAAKEAAAAKDGMGKDSAGKESGNKDGKPTTTDATPEATDKDGKSREFDAPLACALEALRHNVVRGKS